MKKADKIVHNSYSDLKKVPLKDALFHKFFSIFLKVDIENIIQSNRIRKKSYGIFDKVSSGH